MSQRTCLSVQALENREVPALFTVMNLLDSGMGSLRQAVLDANALAGADSIVFDNANTSSKTIVLSGTEIVVSDAVTIAGPTLLGPGAPNVTINAASASRIFNLNESAGVVTFAISGINFINGNGANYGGAITLTSINDNVNLTDCTFSGNKSANMGGAFGAPNLLEATLGTINITRCTFSANVNNFNFGGAIALDASTSAGATSGWKLNITDSTFDGNTSDRNGGAVFMRAMNMTTNISGTTFANNSLSTDAFGGAVSFLTAPAGTATFSNCTFFNNSTLAAGGTVSNGGGASGNYFFYNCTIAGNKSPNGGVIVALTGSPTIRLESTIVFGNSQAKIGAVNVIAKNCILEDINGTTTFLDLGGNLIGVANDPLLGPLQNNGGPTQTRALLPGSPAINVGSNPANVTTDQRGGNFVRVHGTAADIGAFETQPFPHIQLLQINDGSTQRSMVTSLVVTFDQTVTLPINPATAFVLKRQSDNAVVAMSGVVAGNSVTLTFTGGPVDGVSLADGRYTLTALASQINSGNFDGNGDGIAGDDYAHAGNPAAAPQLFRLFGDSDGDGTVAASDFVLFRLAFAAGPPTPFDFDNDGAVAASDFIQFRLRFGGSI